MRQFEVVATAIFDDLVQHALLHIEEIIQLILRVHVPRFEDFLLAHIQIKRAHLW